MKTFPFFFVLCGVSCYEFTGDLTFYGGAGSGGACSSSYVPNGYTTVAINNDQYDNGLACGSCLEGVYHIGGESIYINAIVDNLCPECVYGDLDLGEIGDGRWDLEWSLTECPPIDELIVTTQGSNSYYGKIKVEGGGAVEHVLVNDQHTTPTPDGFWVLEDLTGSLGCGPKLDISFASGKTKTVCADSNLFGGFCSGDQTCNMNSPTILIQKPEETKKPQEPQEPKKQKPEMELLPEVDECVEEFGQCGGKNHTGQVCCKKPCTCVFMNDYYSQCIYTENSNEQCQSRWNQCDGIGFQKTCCKQGSECIFKNKWYSQCL